MANQELKEIDKLIAINDLQQLSPASTTAVNVSIPSGEDFSENRAQNLANIVGSITPTPFLETKEGQELIMNLVEGSVAPVGFIKKPLSTVKSLLKGNMYEKMTKPGEKLIYVGGSLLDKVVDTGTSLTKKITPKIAKPLSKSDIARRESINLEAGLDLGEEYYKKRGKQTFFGRLLEGRSRKKLYNKLATKAEFEKFKNTYPSLALDFNNYKKTIKGVILNNKSSKGSVPIENMIGEYFKEGSVNALGSYSPLSKGIRMASDVHPSDWGSTLRHELKHELDDLFTLGYKTTDYKKLASKLREGLTPYDAKKLSAWEEQVKIAKKLTGRKLEPSSYIKRLQYILDPTETLARTTQLKTKGIGQTIVEALGVPSKPRRELEEFYGRKFVNELIDKYWAAAPIGALGVETKSKDGRAK